MLNEVLLAWIGMTDLKAARGELGDSLGPIGQAVKTRAFSVVHLLSDHDRRDDASFSTWLAHQTSVSPTIHKFKLSSPTEFGEIYEAALSVIQRAKEQLGSTPIFAYHLSPGTPAMASVWILLAKTSQPAELIESSPEKG